MRLIQQHVKSEWVSTLIWAAAMWGLAFAIVLMWGSLRETGMVAEFERIIERVPEGMRALYVSSGTIHTLSGWLQGLAFGGWVHILYVIFSALFVTGILIREMDRRTMEFLLSLPITRAQLLISRWVVFAGSLAALELAHVAGIWTGVLAIGETPELGPYVLAALNSFLVYLALGSALLAVSTQVDDYGRGVGTMIGLGVGSYMAYGLTAGFSGPMASLRSLLPFAMYDLGGIFGRTGTPWADLAALGAMTALFLGLALFLFQRKQIST